jgi:PKD repeat protein
MLNNGTFGAVFVEPRTTHMSMLRPALLVSILLTASAALNAQGPLQAIREYLSEQGPSLGFVPSDVQDLRISSTPSSQAKGSEVVHVIQQVDGRDVHNAIGTFVVQDGRVRLVADRLLRDLRSRIVAGGAMSATNALRQASTALGLPLQEEPVQRAGVRPGAMELLAPSIARQAVQARAILQPDGNGMLHQAWDLSIRTHASDTWWLVAVDASTGAILRRNNIVLTCSFPEAHQHGAPHDDRAALAEDFAVAGGASSGYRVFQRPVESPNHGGRTLVTTPEDGTASPFGWHDVDGLQGAEFTITRGNNVWATEDLDDDDTPGYAPDGGAALDFDFPLNLGADPGNSLDASITNLFFWNNLMHDVWYQYGFDEQSGNFQVNNYGRGGVGEDAVFAQAQDGGGNNNANFATPPDGSSGAMQMYNWTGASLGNNLVVNSPSGVAGAYPSAVAGFGPGLPAEPLTGDLVAVVDDVAPAGDGCNGILNAGAIAGKYALVDRGNCTFVVKVEAMQAAGAIGVIVVNNQPGNPTSMGGTSGLVTIPAVMVSDALGAQLRQALQAGNTVNITLADVGQSADRDGCYDNGVVAHEYGHGISIRLTGGGDNVECLFNAEQMGEGWSDWVGLMLTIEPGDQANDVRGIGTFASGQATTANGIRPAPYTRNTAVNPYTYGATNNANISQPHGIGFVWATMLWDMTWDLIDLYGYDADVYNGDGGNNIAMRLVTEGLKLQACNPGFVDGRDAILLADELIYGGANKCLIWNAFARRGLGFSAQQGSTDDRFDQVEAFDLPLACQLPTVAPQAAFEAALLGGCSGTVSFTDASTQVPQSWSWNFGDGTTSTEQNPSHTYVASGTYTVTLIATNLIGSDSFSQSVTIQLPEPPVASDVSICAGASAQLTATGIGTLQWTDAQGTSVGSGSVLSTPALAASTSYSVRSVVPGPAGFVGPTNNAFGTGGHLQSTFVGTVNLSAQQACTIVSAWVDAATSGTRTFNLWSGSNGTGPLLQSVQVPIPAGAGRIDLGFELPGPGTYSIGGSNTNLYRNDTGAEYPYELSGLLSVTGSSASTGHYYFLYDLEVQGAACASQSVDVAVSVVEPAFSTELSGLQITCTDESVGATSWEWSFGDGATSAEQNPVHTYAQIDSYTVELRINGLDCTAGSTVEFSTGVSERSVGALALLPNPAVDDVVLTFAPLVEAAELTVRDAGGRVVATTHPGAGATSLRMDVSAWAGGIYLFELVGGNGPQHARLLLVR